MLKVCYRAAGHIRR